MGGRAAIVLLILIALIQTLLSDNGMDGLRVSHLTLRESAPGRGYSGSSLPPAGSELPLLPGQPAHRRPWSTPSDDVVVILAAATRRRE